MKLISTRLFAMAAGIIALGSVTSCMTTYDANGRPVQSVDPGLAVAGIAAAGLIGYAAAGDHYHGHHPGYYGRGYYGSGYYGGGYYRNRGFQHGYARSN